MSTMPEESLQPRASAHAKTAQGKSEPWTSAYDYNIRLRTLIATTVLMLLRSVGLSSGNRHSK